ncbi:MAG: ribosome recycling factor [Clostridia bacterium]|nr:ribosome recycling factor [Clostridia bacterium]
MNNFVKDNQKKFDQVLDFFKSDIASLRTGRANPGVLDRVQINAYGVLNPINAVANISVADSHSITLSPWDKGISKEIEKTIIEADLGFGVVNEGDKIRLIVPRLTEETRKETVKKLNDKMEKVRISLRQVREDLKTEIEEAEENKDIAEDDKFRLIKELDEMISDKNDELKEIRDKKEQDIMDI